MINIYNAPLVHLQAFGVSINNETQTMSENIFIPVLIGSLLLLSVSAAQYRTSVADRQRRYGGS